MLGSSTGRNYCLLCEVGREVFWNVAILRAVSVFVRDELAEGVNLHLTVGLLAYFLTPREGQHGRSNTESKEDALSSTCKMIGT